MVGVGDTPLSEDMEDGMTVDAGDKVVDGASVGIEDMVGDIVVDGDIVASLHSRVVVVDFVVANLTNNGSCCTYWAC
jgi:hypothetical protein